MQLKTVGESLTALNSINTVLNNTALNQTAITQGLIAATEGYSTEALIAAASQAGLTEEQLKAILTAKGLTGETLEVAVADAALATSENVATASTIGFSTAIKGLGASLKGLAVAHPILAAITAIAVVAYSAVKIYDAFTISVEEANEALDESLSNFDNATSEIESLNSELSTTQGRIEELQKLADEGTILPEQQEELDNLKESNIELERKIRLKKEEQALEARKGIDNANVLMGAVQTEFTNDGKRTSEWNHYSDRGTSAVAVPNVSLSSEIDRSLNAIKNARETTRIMDTFKSTNEEAYKDLEEHETYARDHAKEMYERANKAKKVYESILAVGDNLTSQEQANYEEALKAIRAYNNMLNYLQGNTDNIDANTNAIKNNTQAKSENQSVTSDRTSQVDFNSAWKALDNTKDEELKSLKKDLTDLADTGMLTADKFKNITGASKWLEDIGLTAEQAADKINKLTDESKQLSSLKTAIGSIQDAYANKKDNGVAGSDDFAKMEGTFGKLGKVWKKYKQTLGSTSSTLDECREAQNKLATAYINSGDFLSKLTEENKEYYIAQLNDLGVKNAEDVVTKVLNQKNAELEQRTNAVKDAYSQLDEKTQKLVGGQEGLQNASIETITNLMSLSTTSDETRTALYNLLVQIGNWKNIDASSSISQLLTMANAAVAAGTATANAMALTEVSKSGDSSAKMNARVNNATDSKQYYAGKYLEDLQKPTKTKQYSIKDVLVNPEKPGGGSNNNGGGGGGGSSSSDTKQEFDWIERKVTRLTTKISILNAQKENLFTVKSKNKNLNKQITQTTKLINTYDKAITKYNKKAKSVKIYKDSKKDKAIKKKIREGKIKGSYSKLIQEYGQTTADAIQKYQNYYDKSQSAKQSKEEARTSKRNLQIEKLQNYVDYYNALSELNSTLAEDTSLSATKRNGYIEKEKNNLKKSYDYQIKIAKKNNDTTEQKRLQAEYQQKLVELSKQEFDNVARDYEKQIQVLGYDMQNLDNKISEIEASGKHVNRAYYDSQKSVNSKTLAQYKAELSALQKRLPTIKKGTDEYYDALDAIQACKDGISECTQKQYELNNAVRQLYTDLYSNVQARISRIAQEQQFLQSLFAHEDLTNKDNGTFTEAGIAKAVSEATSYYSILEKISNAQTRVNELSKMVETGRLTSSVVGDFNSFDDLLKAYHEAMDDEQNLIKERYTTENNLFELMKTKYQTELDYLRELIDKEKKYLQIEKDIHDYQKTLTEKNKNITTLQKQISAYSGDTSQEGLARLQKLQSQLNEAQQDLEETEYDRYISDQNDMLDKLLEDYESRIEDEIKKFKKLVADALDIANTNSSLGNEYLSAIAKHYGYNPEFKPNADLKGGVASQVANIEADETNRSGTKPDANVNNNTPSNKTPAPPSDTFKKQQEKILNDYLNKLAKDKEKAEKIFDNKSYYAKGKKKKAKDYKTKINQYLFEKNGKVLTSSGLKAMKTALGLDSNADIYDYLLTISKKLGNIKNVGGFSKGGIIKPFGRVTDGDNILLRAKDGESILTPLQTKSFVKLADNLDELDFATNLMKKYSSVPSVLGALSNSSRNATNDIDYGGVNFNFDVKSNNPSEMVDAIKHDPKVQKAIQSVSIDRLNKNGNKLSVNKIK